MKRKYSYHVVYTGNNIIGSIKIESSCKIKKYKHLLKIKAYIENVCDIKDVIILNYIYIGRCKPEAEDA